MQPSDAHVLIAANPKSGATSGRSKVSDLRNILLAAGLTVEVCESLELLRDRSRELDSQRRLRAVVAAGGDGTAAAVVNLIPMGVPMALLPLGTENLLAKYLGITSDVEGVVSAILNGEVLRLDAGLAGGRLFLVMLGCGFDAEVVQQLHAARRGHISRWTYSKPICRAVRSYQYPLIEVQCEVEDDPQRDRADAASNSMDADGVGSLATENVRVGAADVAGGIRRDVRTSRGLQNSTSVPAGPWAGQKIAGADLRFTAAWLFAFNLPRYAANLPFCPQADGSDGYLDLCTFARGGTLRSLNYLLHLWLGRHQRLNDFQHVKTKRFRLSSQGVVPYQIDGDPGGILPLDVEVLNERLTLLVPKNYRARA